MCEFFFEYRASHTHIYTPNTHTYVHKIYFKVVIAVKRYFFAAAFLVFVTTSDLTEVRVAL